VNAAAERADGAKRRSFVPRERVAAPRCDRRTEAFEAAPRLIEPNRAATLLKFKAFAAIRNTL
jgi:hypothetical protein